MRRKKWFHGVVLVLCLGMAMAGCSPQPTRSPATPTATQSVADGPVTDYSLEQNWMKLECGEDKPVDVFYLYPTSWARMDEQADPYCTVDDAGMREGAQSAFNAQATAFETVGNLYAPYYRQADAGYILEQPIDQQFDAIQRVPAEDAIAAFDYYIQHYNQGKGFILAGHSQGSMVLLELLSQYMREHPEVARRMVAAYIVGYSVTDSYLQENSHLKFAQGAGDTGGIISYNTEAPQVDGENPVLLEGAISINPITWTRTQEKATADQNLGSYVQTAEGMQRVQGLADAALNLERGTVICSSVSPQIYRSASSLFPAGCYHGFDYGFYYFNLRENAQMRTDAYLQAQQRDAA